MKSIRPLKVAAIIAASTFIAPAIARAGDMTIKAPLPKSHAIDWTGFYVGANVGYGWGNPTSHLSWESAASNLFAVPLADADYSTKPSGAIGGIQVGYNYQMNAMVLGAEADFQFADVNGSVATPSTLLPNAGPDFAHVSEGERLRTFGTVRGRIGFLATRDLLLFATGGFVFGRVSSDSQWQFDTPPFHHYAGSSIATKTGWAMGGGVEWAINRTWSIKAEYLYYDLGSVQVIGHLDGFPSSFFHTIVDQKVTGNIVRAGLNFHF